MRLVRLGALVGSVVLLVATTVSMVNKRTELTQQVDARATSAVVLTQQSVVGVAARAVAVVDLAGGDTDPADMTRTFAGGTAACVGTVSGQACTGADLFALGSFGVAAGESASTGAPAVTVDEATDSVLVVSRGDVTAAIQLPSSALIDPSTVALLDSAGATAEASVSSDPTTTALGEPTTVDGLRVIDATVAVPGDGGSIRVRAATTDDSGLSGDGLGLYLWLLGLGTVLMALAGWTFLLDRRSLERRATTDELTGLVNRREFERLAAEELLAAERFNTGVCLMLIDLNGFKQVNDTLGHQFGDLVLQAGAQRLRSSVRDTDVVGRWGGDEFVILLPGIEDASAVRSSAERIGGNLAETPIVGDVSIGASIGAALFPRHGADLDQLIRAADVAMYGAKTTGVIHRLADTTTAELAGEALASAGYSGPERRRGHG